MRISLQFEFTRDSSGRFGVYVIAATPEGQALGRPARICDSGWSTEEEAADRLICALRGMFKNSVPGNFNHDFLFSAPEPAKP